MSKNKSHTRPISPSSMETHFVDIHEVLHEEGEEEEGGDNNKGGVDHHKRFNNRPMKFREARRQHRGFSRQVSLETGFSALRDFQAKDERRVLPRSGRSVGSAANNFRLGGEARKGDFSRFMTKSSLSKQNSLLPNRNKEREGEFQNAEHHGPGGEHDLESVNESVPVGRYYAALRGPELDQIKESEDILLPKDEKWPFLLRFPIGCYGICLGLSSQVVLWRSLSTSPATRFLHISPYINLGLWFLALAILFSVSFTYTLKCIFYFEAVKREWFHPVRVNFFFAPWVVCMFLAIGAPPSLAPDKLHPAIWCAFMGPYLFLELKIYGQWLSGGKRRLCKVANPSSHLSVVGNFVGAILASRVGWEEPAKFFWAVGFAHYLVLFVTLYQRLPTSEALPKELHPVYSMFIAAPSAASVAWQNIYGEFDATSRTCFFIALFLYASLVVRINFFTGFRFSVAWWSYTFPMTTVAVATIKYAEAVPCVISKSLALGLSFMSSTMVCVLFVSTFLHAFVWHTLFPNDLAIAIANTKKKPFTKEKKPFKKAYDLRRWAKQTSAATNQKKDSGGENEE